MQKIDDKKRMFLMPELFGYRNPIYFVPETFGNTVMTWARAEYSMGIIVQHFSSNEKILAKFKNPRHSPTTWNIIEELKKHTRKEYEQFILEWKNLLEFREKEDEEAPGEYSKKDFDTFIKGLHAARESRNALAHEICKMELDRHRKIIINALKTDSLTENLEKMMADNIVKHSDEMLKVIGKHMEIIFHVAAPAIMFLIWLQITNRIPMPKL